VAAGSYWITSCAEKIRGRLKALIELDEASLSVADLPPKMAELLTCFNYLMERHIFSSVTMSLQEYVSYIHSFAMRTPDLLAKVPSVGQDIPAASQKVIYLSETALFRVKIYVTKLRGKMNISPDPTTERVQRKLIELPKLMIDYLRKIE
jgi:hypothetical protein